MFDRYPESVEMRMPAVVSGMLHVVLLGAAVLNLSFFDRPPLMEPEPVMVDFEMIDKKAAAPKVGNPQERIPDRAKSRFAALFHLRTPSTGELSGL